MRGAPSSVRATVPAPEARAVSCPMQSIRVTLMPVAGTTSVVLVGHGSSQSSGAGKVLPAGS